MCWRRAHCCSPRPTLASSLSHLQGCPPTAAACSRVSAASWLCYAAAERGRAERLPPPGQPEQQRRRAAATRRRLCRRRHEPQRVAGAQQAHLAAVPHELAQPHALLQPGSQRLRLGCAAEGRGAARALLLPPPPLVAANRRALACRLIITLLLLLSGSRCVPRLCAAVQLGARQRTQGARPCVRRRRERRAAAGAAAAAAAGRLAACGARDAAVAINSVEKR